MPIMSLSLIMPIMSLSPIMPIMSLSLIMPIMSLRVEIYFFVYVVFYFSGIWGDKESFFHVSHAKYIHVTG